MRIGDRDLDLDQAVELLQHYAVNYANTVRLYDLAGAPDGRRVPEAPPTQSIKSPLAISAALSS